MFFCTFSQKNYKKKTPQSFILNFFHENTEILLKNRYFGASTFKISRKLTLNNVKIKFKFQPNLIRHKKLRFYGQYFKILGYSLHVIKDNKCGPHFY